MPRLIPSTFDREYDRERLGLTAIAKRLIDSDRSAYRKAGRALDDEFTAQKARKRLTDQLKQNRAVVAGQPVTSNRGGSKRSAIETFVGANRTGDLTLALGQNLLRREREANARRALLLAVTATDPDATEDLGTLTDLARAPWTAPKAHRKPVLDRAAVCGHWGHECISLMREAIQVLDPGAALPPSVTAARSAAVHAHLIATEEKLNRRNAEERRERERAARADQLARPLTLREGVEQLRALASLRSEERLPSVYEGAGFIILKLVRGGALANEQRVRQLVLAADALPAIPHGLAIWADAATALRESHGLARGSTFDTFSEDAALMANRLEAADSRAEGPLHPATRIDTPAGLPSASEDKSECRHGDDFTWAVRYGTKYQFSKGNQAATVKCLWEQWDKSGRQDGCGMSDESIAGAISSEDKKFRLAAVFRNHPALGKMICPTGKKGVYALYRAPPGPTPRAKKQRRSKKK